MLGNFSSPLASSYLSAFWGFVLGVVLFTFLLLLIFFQNKFIFRKYPQPDFVAILTNLEILAFLIAYTFLLNGNRILEPYLSANFLSLMPLLLYFTAFWVYHYTHLKSQKEKCRSASHATDQVLLMAPFVIPLLAYIVLYDLFDRFGWLSNNWIYYSASILYLFLMFLIIPPITQIIWQCKPLNRPELETNLEIICQRAKFRHGGFKVWTILNNSLTAAIMGPVPRFRYVMFTKRLLDTFSRESIEAILAHEIGHSFHKHLFIYPFVLLGMVQSAGLVFILLGDTIASAAHLRPNLIWLISLSGFVLYAMLIGIYFRFVFGFYSRLFERQADLHVYKLNVPVNYMIEALDHIGIATGFTHEIPNWHHFSIKERIDFLNRTIANPRLIARHHKKVRLNVFLLIITVGLVTFLMAAPFFPEIWPFNIIDEKLSEISIKISMFLSEYI